MRLVGWGARPPVKEFFVGVDLGQAKDFTAFAIIEGGPIYKVRHLERMRGMPYPRVVDRLYSMVNSPELLEGVIHLVVDKTGVGAPVVDLIKDRGLSPISISITGGDRPSAEDKKHWRVPKRDLISNLLVLSQTHRLKIAADLEEALILAEELQDLRVRIDPITAHDSYSAWREGQHDDLVLAVALAAWWAENKPLLPIYVGAIMM